MALVANWHLASESQLGGGAGHESTTLRKVQKQFACCLGGLEA